MGMIYKRGEVLVYKEIGPPRVQGFPACRQYISPPTMER